MRLLLVILFLCLSWQHATAQPQTPTEALEALPIQHLGRVMPWSTYAQRVAVQLTGRTRWPESRGPEAFAGRDAMGLLGDLMFRAETLASRELILLDRRSLKSQVGLDAERRFFTPEELMANGGIAAIADGFRARRQADTKAQPTPDERAAAETQESVSLFLMFANDMPLAVVPRDEGEAYLRASAAMGDPGTEHVRAALAELKRAWGTPAAAAAATALADTINAEPSYSGPTRTRIAREVFYNDHSPWKWAAVACGSAILALGLGWLTRWKIAFALAGLLIIWAVAEQVLGISLRVLILGRAPVSNTYEGLLWMGLVSISVGAIAQAFSRKSWYLAGGVGASMIAMLFAMLVPLADRTNTLPAVLRSNYWLSLHVLTIVASYGALLLAAVLGHVYLVRNVLMRKTEAAPESRVIVQVYRVIQLGLILLTAGTILGGVWAADSWGRFWGWDPKETWSLISIIIYFAVIHARYVGWLRDLGLAVASIAAFLAIVWTFYGVNFVMASGLHSYGFGSGGEIYVAAWAAAELVFIAACLIRARANRPGPDARGNPDSSSNALAMD